MGFAAGIGDGQECLHGSFGIVLLDSTFSQIKQRIGRQRIPGQPLPGVLFQFRPFLGGESSSAGFSQAIDFISSVDLMPFPAGEAGG